MRKIAEVEDVPLGTGRWCRPVGGRSRSSTSTARFYAIDNACTHRGGPLGAGWLDGTVVTCPWYANRFIVTTGKALNGTAPVATYVVEVRGRDVLVDLPDAVPPA
jgi:nitrite reductase/ring-hydroxylating ferredoxin subunit